MKWLHKSLSILGLAVVAAGMLVGIASASNTDTGDRIVQGTTDYTVFEAGRSVTVTGTVNGDIFCAGQTVTIDATVNGDVICAGQTITITGKVNGNVRLAGQTVSLGGDITKNASVAGQVITVASGARIGQDANLTGQTINVTGPTVRDIVATGEAININSEVGRNLTAFTNVLRLNDNAKITGSLEYTSPNTLSKSDSASVSGETTYHKSEARKHETVDVTAGLMAFKLYWIVAMLLMAVVLVALFPRLFSRLNVSWPNTFWKAILAGFIAMFAVPLITILLAATVVGIPLAILFGLVWIIILMLAMPLASYFFGRLILPNNHPVVAVLVGGLILSVVTLIPFLGWLVGLVSYWLGTGMAILGIKDSYRRPVYEVSGAVSKKSR